MTRLTAPSALATAELEIVGRVMPASNATFVGIVDGVQVVYKPVAGERPLWDFPDGSLAQREVAAYAVSESLGWEVVPPTLLRDGPHGPGMVQVWAEPEADRAPVDIVPEGEVPEGYRHVLDALGPDDEPVSLVHECSETLRRMTLFDVLVNNGDRKGGHVLAMPDGHCYGVDHGVSFHVDNKLRSVLWGWVGEPLADDERVAVESVMSDGALGDRLKDLINAHELAAFHARGRELLDAGAFPAPSGEWPAIPWPAF